MATPHYPSLYQINTRVRLTELSRKLGRTATLDDIPDDELDRLAKMGFDWVWLLSVWRTGPRSQRVSRTNAEWRREFQETLPDLREEGAVGGGSLVLRPGDAELLVVQRLVDRLLERMPLRPCRPQQDALDRASDHLLLQPRLFADALPDGVADPLLLLRMRRRQRRRREGWRDTGRLQDTRGRVSSDWRQIAVANVHASDRHRPVFRLRQQDIADAHFGDLVVGMTEDHDIDTRNFGYFIRDIFTRPSPRI